MSSDMAGLLPDFDSNRLILREASEAEKLQSWRNNSVSWKGKSTVDQYIEQQILNGNQELTRNGRIRYWVYTDGKQIYTSAETIQKRVVVCHRGGNPTESWSYGVASVFTPLQFRQHGCASNMMRKLAEWLDSEGVVCELTMLWSAVGGFYEPFGWIVFDTEEALIPAAKYTREGSRSLSCDDIKSICRRDVESISSQCGYTSQRSEMDACVASLPTYEQAEWYFNSEDYVASQLYPQPPQAPEAKGAEALEEMGTWCYWFHDFNANKLIILRLSFDENDNAPGSKSNNSTALGAILRAACNEAHSWGLEHVSIWQPNRRVIEASQEVLGIRPRVLDQIEINIPCLQ